MATIRIGNQGLVGVNDFLAGQINADVTIPAELAAGSANVITGNPIAVVTINLPLATSDTVKSGTVIKFKNLLTETTPMSGVTQEIIIGRNGSLIDGRTENWDTNSYNDHVTFIYTNVAVGWVVYP